MRAGGSAAAVMNAANEVAVGAFLDKRISFLAIPRLIEDVLTALPVEEVNDMQDVLLADAAARTLAQEIILR